MLQRRFLALAGLAAGLLLASASPLRAAEPFPTKPLVIVVSAAPGGSPDILARIIAPALSARLGQPVTVENKPGGAGNLAAAHVARSAPDGYTLFIANDSLSVNETLFEKLPFHPVKSFTPVVHAISSPQVFAVNAAVPVRSVKEFVAAAKAEPGRYALASPAIGTTGQLGVLLLQNQAAIQVNPIVYRSAQPALTDVLGGHAHGIVVTVAPALPFIREGKLRALGVSSATRSRALPDVPTFVEQGLPDFKFDSWQGFVVPAGTPREVVQRLNQELNAVLQQADVRDALTQQAFDVKGGSGEDFGRLIADSIGTWAAVIRANNIRLE